MFEKVGKEKISKSIRARQQSAEKKRERKLLLLLGGEWSRYDFKKLY